MWMEFISSTNSEYQFLPGCTDSDLKMSERDLGFSLPDDLRRLLQESNGIVGNYEIPLIWNLERIVKTNREFRTTRDFKDLYMPFDSLLFFADAGNGDQFAFPMNGNVVIKAEIYAWDHEDDSRNWISSSLENFIKDWNSGKIKV